MGGGRRRATEFWPWFGHAGLGMVAIFFSAAARADINPRLAIEKNLVERRDEVGLRMVGQRFIAPADWQSALRGRFRDGDAPEGAPPYFAHGRDEFEAFWSATRYVLQVGEARLPSINDYLKLGEMAANPPATLPFGAELSRPRSNLRDGSADETDSSSPGPQRVSAGELRALQTNTLLRISVLETHPEGTYLVAVAPPPGREVRGLLDGLFGRVSRDAAKLLAAGRRPGDTSYQIEAIRIAAYFYLSLIEIRGLKGGGASASKLVRDWLLRYFGLDVPNESPAEDDYTWSQLDYQVLLASQIATTRHWLDTFGRVTPSRPDGTCARGLTRKRRR